MVAVITDTCQVFKLGKSGRSLGIALDQASRPHCAAPGPRGETWVSLEGRDRYMVFQPGDGEVRLIELDPDPASRGACAP